MDFDSAWGSLPPTTARNGMHFDYHHHLASTSYPLFLEDSKDGINCSILQEPHYKVQEKPAGRKNEKGCTQTPVVGCESPGPLLYLPQITHHDLNNGIDSKRHIYYHQPASNIPPHEPYPFQCLNQKRRTSSFNGSANQNISLTKPFQSKSMISSVYGPAPATNMHQDHLHHKINHQLSSSVIGSNNNSNNKMFQDNDIVKATTSTDSTTTTIESRSFPPQTCQASCPDEVHPVSSMKEQSTNTPNEGDENNHLTQKRLESGTHQTEEKENGQEGDVINGFHSPQMNEEGEVIEREETIRPSSIPSDRGINSRADDEGQFQCAEGRDVSGCPTFVGQGCPTVVPQGGGDGKEKQIIDDRYLVNHAAESEDRDDIFDIVTGRRVGETEEAWIEEGKSVEIQEGGKSREEEMEESQQKVQQYIQQQSYIQQQNYIQQQLYVHHNQYLQQQHYIQQQQQYMPQQNQLYSYYINPYYHNSNIYRSHEVPRAHSSLNDYHPNYDNIENNNHISYAPLSYPSCPNIQQQYPNCPNIQQQYPNCPNIQQQYPNCPNIQQQHYEVNYPPYPQNDCYDRMLNHDQLDEGGEEGMRIVDESKLPMSEGLIRKPTVSSSDDAHDDEEENNNQHDIYNYYSSSNNNNHYNYNYNNYNDYNNNNYLLPNNNVYSIYSPGYYFTGAANDHFYETSSVGDMSFVQRRGCGPNSIYNNMSLDETNHRYPIGKHQTSLLNKIKSNNNKGSYTSLGKRGEMGPNSVGNITSNLLPPESTANGSNNHLFGVLGGSGTGFLSGTLFGVNKRNTGGGGNGGNVEGVNRSDTQRTTPSNESTKQRLLLWMGCC